MNIEEQVCSLELSKRLKELGGKQESLFYWIDPDDKPKLLPTITELDRSMFNFATNGDFP